MPPQFSTKQLIILNENKYYCYAKKSDFTVATESFFPCWVLLNTAQDILFKFNSQVKFHTH